MRKFAGKTETKKVPFMDGDLEIRKLTAGAVKRIGKAASTVDADDENSAMKSLLVIINESVVMPEGEADLTLEELDDFPLDALNNLAVEIMSYAGVDGTLGNADA